MRAVEFYGIPFSLIKFCRIFKILRRGGMAADGAKRRLGRGVATGGVIQQHGDRHVKILKFTRRLAVKFCKLYKSSGIPRRINRKIKFYKRNPFRGILHALVAR
ncbi:hypothetical protein CGRAC_0814 [Campylobacter gracilis]|uniref:Uncharacterized protein n=1 Tax=Campylobacter gracilis RM3268 TaxID=553220 RepID=C8PJK1_9BACT|nr:hypothetical protein CGRAC_0814 [Campylobacter gracilis]EEV17106.1 hypothetical protein CAMGR0001_1401 [Campylobacter gracilis RM3268]